MDKDTENTTSTADIVANAAVAAAGTTADAGVVAESTVKTTSSLTAERTTVTSGLAAIDSQFPNLGLGETLKSRNPLELYKK